MNNLIEYKLANFIQNIFDIGSNGSDENISKNLKMLDNEDYAYMVRTLNFNANNFKNNMKYVSQETYEYFKKSKIFGDEIIINKIGCPGSLWLMPRLDKPVSLGLNQYALVINEKINTHYLYYNLKNIEEYIKSQAHGTTTKTLTKQDIKDIKIFIFNNISIQNKISFFLDKLNEKIELNKKINEELEKMAKTLYDYWFVQFDFPDENGRPYKSSGGKMHYDEKNKRNIPLDWKIQNFNNNDLTKIIQPGINKFENEKIYLPTASIQDDKIVDFSYKITYENRESRANMQPISNSVWFAKMKNSKKVLYFADYSQEYINKLILSTGLCGLYCKDNTIEYIWNTINSEYFEVRKDSLAHGATQEAVNNDDLISIPLLVPPISIIEKYHNKTTALYYQKYLNELENQKLIQLRDWLLPLLMNGQVVIKK